jgi:multisubunit Na+/H+ antiporter MnhB subunit
MRTALLELVAKLLFLPLLVVAAAFLVKGYSETGGGFAAGAVAGVAVLLQRIVFGHDVARQLVRPSVRKAALGGGLGVALLVALVPAVTGGDLLTHHPRPQGEVARFGALELHTSLLFDLGVFLLVFAFVLEAVAIVAPEGDPEK